MTLVSSLYQILNYHNSISIIQGRSHCGGGQEAIDPSSISRSSKAQQFQFQISAILLFTGVHKLYGSGISLFLPYMLELFNNLRRLLISSNYELRGK